MGISSSPRGYLQLVLHAHLPYIRYPEHNQHLEERWLYEAITETYIPLLHVFGNLLSDNVDFRITISLTPTLIEMFNDELLMSRYRDYLDRLIDLAEKETFRTRNNHEFRTVARMYRKRFSETRRLFEYVYGGDLSSAFGSLSASGKIEIISSAATHSYLPALFSEKGADDTAARAQILLGAEHFRRTFGRKAAGMWLPECGFTPGIAPLLKEAGIGFFFLESHGILNSVPKSGNSIYAPLRTPSGVIAFSRDAETSRQVWSASCGYPGDRDYRDFYRDIGFDLDAGYLRPYLPDGARTFTGFKYYKITGKKGGKKPYVISNAIKKAGMHADHFIKSREGQVLYLRGKLKKRPVITAAYDAELFGHWWFEGPEWLNFLFRKGSTGQRVFRFITPSEYILENDAAIETAVPSISSWGARGYSATWLNASNGWIYRHLKRAAKFMTEIASGNSNASGLLRLALNQAARELLLAQASDWAFMMKGDNSEFAENKLKEHLRNFLSLHGDIISGSIRKENLSILESKNNIFPEIDYRIFSTSERQPSSLSKG